MSLLEADLCTAPCAAYNSDRGTAIVHGAATKPL